MAIREEFQGASQMLPPWLEGGDWSDARYWSRGMMEELRYALGSIERDIYPVLKMWQPEKAQEMFFCLDELKGATRGYHSDRVYADASQAYDKLRTILSSLDQEEAYEESGEE